MGLAEGDDALAGAYAELDSGVLYRVGETREVRHRDDVIHETRHLRRVPTSAAAAHTRDLSSPRGHLRAVVFALMASASSWNAVDARTCIVSPRCDWRREGGR